MERFGRYYIETSFLFYFFQYNEDESIRNTRTERYGRTKGRELPQTDVEIESDIVLDEPPMYRVLLHNDDYTTMDFVVHVLKTIFHKNEQESERIMLAVHEKGKGVCGIYTREIAQTKVEQVKVLAKQNQFPLLATYEIDA